MPMNNFSSIDWDNITLANDFMFCKVMSNENVCKQLLEHLLHIKISKLEYAVPQKSIDVAYDSKGIRLDVYVADSDRVFDVEMQTTIKADLPKRTRYYQSLIDIDTISKGKLYTDLKESYVIFICTEDPFTKGLSSYTFENICLEDASLHLNDKTHKVFYNSSTYKTEKDPDVRAFLEYLANGKASSDFTSQINNLVQEAKHNERWRAEYMTLEMIKLEEKEAGVQQGIAIGEKNGERNKAIDTARNLKQMGLSSEQIAKATGLTLDEVKSL